MEADPAPPLARGAAPPAGPAQPARPLVSVVVPTFNRRASLQRLLEGLARQDVAAGELEVLAVDDGSADGTPGWLRQQTYPFPLRVLEQPHQGPAQARNLGVEQARGELILFLDDDVVPQPGLIATHLATHGEGSDLVVIGPMLPPGDWPRPVWVRWEEDQLLVQYRDLAAGKYACSPRQLYTGNASLSRDRFLAAGGFDSGFTRAEDVELGYRLRDAGATFVFVPQAAVLHYASRTFESWCRTPYQYGRFDVVMHVAKGHEALACAAREFHERHPLTRVVARLCVGREWAVEGTAGLLRRVATGAAGLGWRRPAALALSGIFNLLYWQGVSDALGGRAAVLCLVAEGRARA